MELPGMGRMSGLRGIFKRFQIVDPGWMICIRPMPKGHSRSARGEVLVDADVWEIDPQVPGSAAERGVVGLAIEALEFFGVDLKEMAAEKLAQWLEHKKSVEAGLYPLVLDEGFKLTPAGKLPAKTSDDPPLLVFIHGTASNTEGSFGALWSDNNHQRQAVAGAARCRLQERRFRLRTPLPLPRVRSTMPWNWLPPCLRVRRCIWSAIHAAGWWANCSVWGSAGWTRIR